MYFQEDTVLRMIEQLGAAYRQLMQLLDDLEAEGELDKLFRQLAGLDRNTAKGLSVEALTDILTPERRMAMSELILAETERFAHRLEEEVAQGERHRALMLLCGIDNDEIAGKRADRAKEVFDRCFELCTATETARVLRFLWLGGAFAAAEDVLFLQMDSFARPEDLRVLADAGEELYASLLNETDARLAQGNLPREEVLQGRAAFFARAAALGAGCAL